MALELIESPSWPNFDIVPVQELISHVWKTKLNLKKSSEMLRKQQKDIKVDGEKKDGVTDSSKNSNTSMHQREKSISEEMTYVAFVEGGGGGNGGEGGEGNGEGRLEERELKDIVKTTTK